MPGSDKMKKILGLLLALALAGAALLALPANVTGQAEPLDWVVGTGWYFGETVNFDELQDEIDQGLQDLPPGFRADVNVAGGVGTYLGIEVVDDDADANGYTCYQVDISGAVGVDFGLDASVDGTYSDQGMSIDVDASGNAFVVGEANLLISLFFTADTSRELVKIDAQFTAEANAELSVDALVDLDMGGFGGIEGFDTNQHFDVKADVTAEAKNVVITGSILFDPPLDFFDFPIYEGDVWWVPESGTQVTTTYSAQGTVEITADVTGIPNEPDVHETESMNLAVEIGSGTDGPNYVWQQTMFECVAVYGNNYIIETSAGDFINFFDWGGVRQYGVDYLDLLPVDDMIPVENAGVQYNADEGFITGLSIDGEVQTTTSDEATVDNFAADPLGEVQGTTGGHGSVGEGGGGLLPLLILAIIVIVVVLVVVAMMANKGKKKNQGDMYGAPPPQQPAPYQQPPPPQQPPQYPPQQPPPPPPPPGQ
jgi:hypothetical protein